MKGGEEATQDEYTSISLPASIKETFIQRSRLLLRDTEFLYVTLPVTGMKDDRKIVCPLLLYPIRVVDGELFVNLDQVRINPAIFTTFGVPTSLESDFLDVIPDGTLGAVSPILLGNVLKTHLPDLELSSLDAFPSLATSGEVREASKKKTLRMHAASAVVLTERSKNVAGLLELDLLTQTDQEKMSAPLWAFLDPEENTELADQSKGQPEFIPAMLSDSQLSLIDSINSSIITACQGPPGTGKSFSIAAAVTEQVLRGRSVLICCRSDEAADVLQTKLGSMVPSFQQVVRAGRKKHLRSLRSKVTRLISSKVEAPLSEVHFCGCISKSKTQFMGFIVKSNGCVTRSKMD